MCALGFLATERESSRAEEGKVCRSISPGAGEMKRGCVTWSPTKAWLPHIMQRPQVKHIPWVYLAVFSKGFETKIHLNNYLPPAQCLSFLFSFLLIDMEIFPTYIT